MALIKCPECKNSISNKAEKCPHCGVPASYFADLGQELEVAPASQLDYKNLGNILISFDSDYCKTFGTDNYITK